MHAVYHNNSDTQHPRWEIMHAVYHNNGDAKHPHYKIMHVLYHNHNDQWAISEHLCRISAKNNKASFNTRKDRIIDHLRWVRIKINHTSVPYPIAMTNIQNIIIMIKIGRFLIRY